MAQPPVSSVRSRPPSVTGLSLFFALGAIMSSSALVALAFPGSALEPMWRLNPRAREQFGGMGGWALVFMFVVAVLCVLTAVGLWRGTRLGFLLGVTMLAVSLLGDLARALLGPEPRAWLGVPIAAIFLILLTRRSARAFFVGSLRT